ncbi:MAG: hypothetical protein R2695_11760 [Acidimicrobiales bacterium]
MTGLTVADPEHDRIAVDDVSFDIHAGEILGVASKVEGNGQSELVAATTDRRRGVRHDHPSRRRHHPMVGAAAAEAGLGLRPL